MSTELPALLWHSNSPWAATGYAQQTALFLPRLKEHFRLGCSAFYGLEGAVIPWQDIPIYPGIGATYGNETIRDHAKIHLGGLRDGLVFTLLDVWVLDAAVWREMNVACWVPVDHEPVPPPIADFFRTSGAVPVAMSRFGQRQLADLDPLYCPHAVDCSVYRPHPQDEAREATKMPEGFIVGMVAANKGNPSRKAFAESFIAFRGLLEKHPDAKLYVHTEVAGRFGGVDLPQLLRAVGVPLASVLFPDQYRAVHFPFPAETMAQIYSSMDVLLAASCGEGFGIPVLEAQACGVPVIVSDFSAQPELCGAGWLVSGRKVYTPLKAWQFLPDPDDILDALLRAYAMSPGAREEASGKARAFAQQYHIDHVLTEYMLPVLKQAAERFDERAPRELVAA